MAIKEITDRLPDYHFDLITAKLKPGLPAFERIGNVNVYRIGWGSSLDKFLLAKFGIFKIWPAAAGQKVDIMWVVMAGWNAIPALLLKILRPKIKLVLTLQEGDPIEGRRLGLVALVWRLVLKKADLVTVISNYLGELARKYGYKGPIELVPNGVDISHFSRVTLGAGERAALLRSKFGIKEDDVVLITASRLVRKNAVGDIIEALKFLPENVKLLIAGTGPLEHELRLKIKNLGIKDRVLMLGHIDHSDLPKYLHASDIFVRPSLSEGMGNAFLEAMAAGLPVIATEVGGIKDFLVNEQTGLFCKVNDAKSIAEQVIRIISDKTLRGHLIKSAYSMVRDEYDWSTSIRGKMKTIFDKLAN